MKVRLPSRIACLSTETVEVLYDLGEEARIVGISGFTVHPPRARKEKPKISGFSSAKIDHILAVDPDLVLAFSNLQAGMVAELIKAGVEVHHFNQRGVEDILAMVETVGRLVGAQDRAAHLVAELEDCIATAKAAAARRSRQPRVYFEEWTDPLISGIGWVSELIAIAGGEDVFAELGRCHGAKERIIADPMEVVRRAPDILIGSWCGKKFRSEQVAVRPGWERVPAVFSGQLHEIKSADILAPGPAAIRRGLAQLTRILDAWAGA
ncbi:MAG TPA: ABC transporter substrate-binding protein [Rhodocyclaceae bacterium]|nr:ABC transporter substrate-binding protein [Rhodocyclaceae bacterium]